MSFVTASRVLASLSSVGMLLSPMPSIVRTVRNKSTGYASIVPLVSMVLNVQLLMIFGYLSEQYFPVFATFAFGEVLVLCYTSVFYYYTKEKAKARKVFMIYAVPYITLSIYGVVGGLGYTGQTRHQVGNIMGYFTIATQITVFSSPLEKIRPVLKHKSAVFFNIPMIYAGVFCNAMWVMYSTLTKHWIIFAPNAFSLVMGCIEITLYWIFHPSTHPLPALPVTSSMATMVAPAVEDATEPKSASSPKSPDTADEDSDADVTHVCVVAINDDDKDETSFVELASPHTVNFNGQRV